MRLGYPFGSIVPSYATAIGSSANRPASLAELVGIILNGGIRYPITSRRLFPGYHIRAITNGVHPYTWTGPEFSKLYDEYVKGWCHEPELLVRADRIPNEDIWSAHIQAKNKLITKAKEICGIELEPGLPILGFARRVTDYKVLTCFRYGAFEVYRSAMAFPGCPRWQSSSTRRRWQTADRVNARLYPGTERGYSYGLFPELQYGTRFYHHIWCGCIA